MSDIVELIRAEHARISRLIEKVDGALMDAAPAGPRSEQQLVWEELAGYLEFHIAAAGEIYYRALETVGPGVAQAVMQACDADTDVREAIEESELSLPGSAEWQMAIRSARDAALSHISCVESGPLAQFRLSIAPAVRGLLGRQWVDFMAARSLDESTAVQPGSRTRRHSFRPDHYL